MAKPEGENLIAKPEGTGAAKNPLLPPLHHACNKILAGPWALALFALPALKHVVFSKAIA